MITKMIKCVGFTLVLLFALVSIVMRVSWLCENGKDVTTTLTETSPEAPLILEPLPEIYYDCPLDADLQDYIRDICERNDVPMSLVLALISVESTFRPGVISKTNDYGLMQINVINHEWLMEEHGITDFLDPYQNVYGGVVILSGHLAKYGDEHKALMAYRHGTTGAKRLWNEGVYATEYTNRILDIKEKYDNEIKQSHWQ